jgi:hypothetical protein
MVVIRRELPRTKERESGPKPRRIVLPRILLPRVAQPLAALLHLVALLYAARAGCPRRL